MAAAWRLLWVCQISTVHVVRAAWGRHHDRPGDVIHGWRRVPIGRYELENENSVHWGVYSVNTAAGEALHTGLMTRGVEGHAGIWRAGQDAIGLHVQGTLLIS